MMSQTREPSTSVISGSPVLLLNWPIRIQQRDGIGSRRVSQRQCVPFSVHPCSGKLPMWWLEAFVLPVRQEATGFREKSWWKRTDTSARGRGPSHWDKKRLNHRSAFPLDVSFSPERVKAAEEGTTLSPEVPLDGEKYNHFFKKNKSARNDTPITMNE